MRNEDRSVEPRARRMPASAWKLFLVCVPLFTGLYLMLPVDGMSRTIAYPLFGLIAAGVIAVGLAPGGAAVDLGGLPGLARRTGASAAS